MYACCVYTYIILYYCYCAEIKSFPVHTRGRYCVSTESRKTTMWRGNKGRENNLTGQSLAPAGRAKGAVGGGVALTKSTHIPLYTHSDMPRARTMLSALHPPPPPPTPLPRRPAQVPYPRSVFDYFSTPHPFVSLARTYNIYMLCLSIYAVAFMYTTPAHAYQIHNNTLTSYTERMRTH